MIVDVELMSSLYHDEAQIDHDLSACVWAAVDGQEWALNAQAKTVSTTIVLQLLKHW